MESQERRIDAAALKGLAHPLRVDIYDSLIMGGPATASMLADRLGESSGATSYHLRQLARHGFVEEDPSRGTGRERWWTVVRGGVTLSPSDLKDDHAAHDSAIMVARQFADQRARHIDAFLRRGDEFDQEWIEASRMMSARASLTSAELFELGEKLSAVLGEFLESRRDREPVAGERTVATHLNLFPVVDAGGEREGERS